jgi:hypothetical protein
MNINTALKMKGQIDVSKITIGIVKICVAKMKYLGTL